ncbi:tRNA(His) guanylyltransferase [[Candida] railenensis]|uniref:tRNA(His) guanylyltransferase n=1 Tax=[Candida] railenensis TaxID=45579 RepID=A0A9P0W120_9ASCO|nr:tRNA(His) guanylyltransferase [[Candida] railenensis]
MANSRFEYVRSFERENIFPQETYLVVRVDGRGFHKFSAEYDFTKPNDLDALKVMNLAARSLAEAIPDIILAYGDSDEYSFLLRKNCELFERRESKLISTFSSTITAYYQHHWSVVFPSKPLKIERLPTFDARVVMYPTAKLIKDYFSWRQVDCHINNLYNTSFWTLVEKGHLTPKEAEEKLKGTLAADKNEILFKEFGINYNNEPEIFKKGSILVRENPSLLAVPEDGSNLSERQKQREMKKLRKSKIELYHIDIIKEDFWSTRQYIFE